ncbi:MAG TPA: uroporphyrinogen decarboxylase family protein [Caldilineaceae bacterium]|nr:uroporphyrinogen decarboxylase family protein [Caldilineaceae bacterium]
MSMSKRARLEAIFAGADVDRPAVALWRHWPVDDLRGGELARATLTFQQTYDFDFIKVTPNSNFCVEGYGAQSSWVGNEEGTYVWGPRVIRSPEDWTRLRPLEPDHGLQGEVLAANRLVGEAVGESVPFIQTIFNPLSQAKNLAGDRLLADLRQHPEAVRAGLMTITESIVRFIDRLKTTGAAGIFLAVQHASYDLLTEEEYRSFGRPFDLEILAATEGMWFNLVHLHGRNVMFDMVADYPAQLINWHDTETPPSLGEALKRTGMALCGGLRQWETMVRGTPEQVAQEAAAALEATQGRRFVLGTGCVTPITAPTCNLTAARRAVEPVTVP